MNCTDNGAAMQPRAITSARTLTRDETQAARQLIAVTLGTGEHEYPDAIALLAKVLSSTEAADDMLHAVLPLSRPVAVLVPTGELCITRRGNRALAVHDVERADLCPKETELMRTLIIRTLRDHTGPGKLGFNGLVNALAGKIGMEVRTVRAMVLAALPPKPVRVSVDGAEWSLLRFGFDSVSLAPARRRSGRRFERWPAAVAAVNSLHAGAVQ